MDEMILIDKPAGMTSFGVVARVRRVLSEKASKEAGEKRKVKVGHTGTLDPFATGLLILMAGKGTKRCQEFLKLDKTYEATLKLGYTSTTGDPEGEVKQVSKDVPRLEEIEKAMAKLTGEIEQVVPAFSAVKINGQRAYKLAREGKAVEMPRRKVKIYQISILEYNYPELKIVCEVSSGTYIRALAEEIGKLLKTGAYLTELRRLKIGNVRVEDAVRLEDWMACQ